MFLNSTIQLFILPIFKVDIFSGNEKVLTEISLPMPTNLIQRLVCKYNEKKNRGGLKNKSYHRLLQIFT